MPTIVCSGYMADYDEDMPLCRCPICKGWLPRFFPLKETFRCKKCGTELMTFPHVDEETREEYLGWGKICPISLPQKIGEN